MLCHCGETVLDEFTDIIDHLFTHMHRLEHAMTESNANEAANQAHLDSDVDAMKTAVSQIVVELKAQAANGQPLDFAKADAFLADVQGQATADAPPAPAPTDPSVPSAPVDPNAPAPTDPSAPPAA